MKQQKVLIKLFVNDQKFLSRILTSACCFPEPKTRTKALQIAISLQGVESVALGGKSKDHIEVQGDGIDSVQLTNRLRRKIGHAYIISVSPVGDNEDTEVEPEMPAMVSSDGVVPEDQYQVYEVSKASITEHPVGDNEDMEMEPEMVAMVSSNGVAPEDEYQVCEMRSDTTVTTQYNDPYGRVFEFVYFV